jgi:aryl-alcohol dehydrogenase-like predicted oxidoreductase
MLEIILGTANFGNKYGIANKGKLLLHDESKAIIDWAQSNGINHFDTALVYGAANELLSVCLDNSLNPIIDTKLDEQSCQSSQLIVESAVRSRNILGVEQLSVLYLHNESLLQTSLAEEISTGLKQVLSLGIAKKIGISVYSESGVLACKRILPELSVFQVPENICDRRLIASSAIQNLSEEGNEFFIRSIFLQGLLLMDPSLIPPELDLARLSIQQLVNFANNSSLSVVELCVAYGNSLPWASGIVVGVNSLNQLREIHETSSRLPEGWMTEVSVMPSEIVDPRKWPL